MDFIFPCSSVDSVAIKQLLKSREKNEHSQLYITE